MVGKRSLLGGILDMTIDEEKLALLEEKINEKAAEVMQEKETLKLAEQKHNKKQEIRCFFI